MKQLANKLRKPDCGAPFDTKLAHEQLSPPRPSNRAEESRLRLIERQARFETETVDIGREAYRAFANSRDVAEVSAGARLMRLMVVPAGVAIEKLQNDYQDKLETNARRPSWVWHLLSLSPDKLAVIATTAVLRGLLEGYAGLRSSSVRSVSLVIAAAAQDQIEFDAWEAAQLADTADAEGGKLLRALMTRYPNVDRAVWARWRTKIALIRAERMDHASSVQFGSALLHGVVSSNAKYVYVAEVGAAANKTELRIMSTSFTEDFVKDMAALAEVAHPPLRPMLCPPNPWIYEGRRATGGYIIHREDLVRANMASHTGQLECPVSQIDLDAINAVQAVPWRINGRVYDVVKQALERKLFLPSLPEQDNTEVPTLLPTEAWASLSQKERQDHSRIRREVYDKRASTRGVEIAVRDRMVVAQTLLEAPAIYFPHSRDFRGRMYPIPSRGPHPQADDLGKSLIHFARGKPLGDTGLYWLCVHAANCAGHNKCSFDDRMAWAWEHYEDIYHTASYPLAPESLAFWASFGDDDPWQLLAACFELAEAMSLDDPSAFVSHLAVPLDGSCNGLQHLSAMGLDEVGAAATNLTSSPIRHDIYEDVAVIVRAIVETDAASGHAEAIAWHGRVTRKVCKRSVMTTPYGVTDRGVKRQLVNDDLCPSWPGQTGKERAALADYLGNCLGTALGQVIKASKSIMAWCQTAATRLAEANLPLDWTTPSGSRVRQAYYEQNRRDIRTLSGRITLYEEQLSGVILKKKAALAASPNVVHSFDAAHLALTVNAAVAEGITDLAMVHDSYGVHACHTLAFSHILRQEFVSIYRTDWITNIRDGILAYAPHVDIPPVPDRNTFDIRQVITAPFFFS